MPLTQAQTDALKGDAAAIAAKRMANTGKLLALALFSLPALAADVTGTLTIIHSDDFANSRSTHQWVVHEDGGMDHKINGLDYRHKHLAGQKVRIKGTLKSDRSLDVVQMDTLAPPAALASTISVLVIPLNFTDAGAPFTQAQIQGTWSLLSNFYAESSYSKLTVSSVVTNPVSIPISKAGGCDYTAVSNAADTAATGAGYNVASYVYRFYVMPTAPCGWTGLGYIGFGRAWSNGSNSPQVYGHELGHNFGLAHGGSVSSTGTGATVSEYGDIDNTMGNRALHHYAAEQKQSLLWLSPAPVFAGGTQSYTLAPYETTGGAMYAVEIPTANANRTFWLEYRQILGYDDALCFNSACTVPIRPGVQLRLSSPFESISGYDDVQYLGNLAAGDVYTDNDSGTSIRVVSADSSSAVVRVTTAAQPPPPNTIVNGSFEIPALSAGGYVYGPAGATWTGGGIQSNGSAFAAPSAPDGRQTAFIQGASSIAQTLTLSAGNYTLSFKVARRQCCAAPNLQPINVTLDGAQIGSTVTPGNAFTSVSIPFSVVAGAHTIAFSGTVNTDMTTFLDAVTLTGGSGGPSPTTMVLGVVTTYTATVTGNNPTGSVRFGAITSCQAVALVSGAASCVAPYVSGVIAYYSGDANNAPSQGQ